MKYTDKKIIYVLLILIIVFATILLMKICSEPKYDKNLYAQVYNQFNEINEYIEENDKNINSNTLVSTGNLHTTINASGQIYTIIAKISIPTIGISYPVLSETTDELMKIAPCKLAGGKPNDIGNFCIIGHNYKDGTHFGKLSKLKIGDSINITDIEYGHTINYKVYEISKINYTDLNCLNQDVGNNKEVTLITCTNNKKIRLIVKCKQ